MDDNQTTVPYGYCHCGCGRKTNLAPQTWRKHGWVRGEPLRFIRGHANRRRVRWILEDRGHDTPCWIWQLWCTPEGYGKAYADGTSAMAHRLEWEKVNGPIPEGLHLDHLCRVPSCVNPDHLEPVTPAENARRSSSATLTRTDVEEIRERLRGGETTVALAREFGVCQATVGHIASGRNWRPD